MDLSELQSAYRTYLMTGEPGDSGLHGGRGFLRRDRAAAHLSQQFPDQPRRGAEQQFPGGPADGRRGFLRPGGARLHPAGAAQQAVPVRIWRRLSRIPGGTAGDGEAALCGGDGEFRVRPHRRLSRAGGGAADRRGDRAGAAGEAGRSAAPPGPACAAAAGALSHPRSVAGASGRGRRTWPRST